MADEEERRMAELELRLGTVEAALARASLGEGSEGEVAGAAAGGGDEGGGLAAEEVAALRARVAAVEEERDKAKDAVARCEYRIKHLLRSLDAAEERVQELEGTRAAATE